MEQLDMSGGSKPIEDVPAWPVGPPGVHYKRFANDRDHFNLASEETRRKAVTDLFPEYEWADNESILWNWINAHAGRYFDGDYSKARQMVNEASDPIFGGKNYRKISQFIWWIA